MKKTENMPDLVFIGLLGINSKTSAYTYLFISLALALVSIYLGMKNPIFYFGAFFLLASVWYFYCINWVNQNSSWDN